MIELTYGYIRKNENNNIKIKMKPEYASEWGILPNHKYAKLKESIKVSGQLEPIILDQYGNIVNGHNRYKILQELGIPTKYEVRKFKDELSARDFLISTNLFVKESSLYVRISKAEKLRHIFEEKARLVQQLKLPKKDQKGFQPVSAQSFAPIGRVSKEIAKVAGVSSRTVEKAERIQKTGSQEQIQDLIDDKRSINEVYSEIDSKERKEHLLQEARMINSQLSLPDDKAMLYLGDIQDPHIVAKIPDNVADISITDPPYEEKYLSLYEALPAIIMKKLKPGASFFSLYGDKLKDRYEECLKAEGLIRVPCEISIELQGPFDHDNTLGITRKKKDMLWYYKPDKEGKRFKTGELLQNLIKSTKPEKKFSEWEQSSLEAEEIIARNTLPEVGAIVIDPLMGTGSYLAGALRIGRRVIGVEINEGTYNIAKGKLLLQLQPQSHTESSQRIR
jgi:hypothetical protein